MAGFLVTRLRYWPAHEKMSYHTNLNSLINRYYVYLVGLVLFSGGSLYLLPYLLGGESF